AIQARRRELALERERKAALMQHLFTYGTRDQAHATATTRYGQVPKHWMVVLLDRCAYVQTGVTKGRKLDAHRVITVPYLRVANGQDGYLDLSEIQALELDES